MSFLLEKECFQHLRETHLGREQFLRDAKSRFEKGNAKVAMIFTGNLFIIFFILNVRSRSVATRTQGRI